MPAARGNLPGRDRPARVVDQIQDRPGRDVARDVPVNPRHNDGCARCGRSPDVGRTPGFPPKLQQRAGGETFSVIMALPILSNACGGNYHSPRCEDGAGHTGNVGLSWMG
jgi:hypothetical protein